MSACMESMHVMNEAFRILRYISMSLGALPGTRQLYKRLIYDACVMMYACMRTWALLDVSARRSARSTARSSSFSTASCASCLAASASSSPFSSSSSATRSRSSMVLSAAPPRKPPKSPDGVQLLEPTPAPTTMKSVVPSVRWIDMCVGKYSWHSCSATYRTRHAEPQCKTVQPSFMHDKLEILQVCGG